MRAMARSSSAVISVAAAPSPKIVAVAKSSIAQYFEYVSPTISNTHSTSPAAINDLASQSP